MVEIMQRRQSEAVSSSTSEARSRARSRRSEEGPAAVPIKIEQHAKRPIRKGTGPRTAHGKERSKLNAVKHGLFSQIVLLPGESRAEYVSLLTRLRNDLEPQGAVEELLVENLAILFWRKRRLFRAEKAEVSKQTEFVATEFAVSQYREAWDCSRAAIASGGLLKYIDNRLIVREVRRILEKLRPKATASKNDGESRLWKKLFGQDHDGGMPESLRSLCDLYEAIARQPVQIGDDTAEAKLRSIMVEPLDRQVDLLRELENLLEAEDRDRIEHKKSAAIIPGPEVSDRLIRYETHFSREIERILNRLDRLQRTRNGHSLPPQVDVNIPA